MATKSGITASPELLDEFKQFSDPVLVVKVSSDSTSLVSDGKFVQPKSTDLASVFSSIHDYFSEKYPAPGYAIAKDPQGDFFFISFIPDLGPIRDKMLFALTKNTFLQQLGTNNFKKHHVFAWTDLDELTESNFNKSTKDEADVLTTDEKVLQEIDSLQQLKLAQGERQIPSINNHKPAGATGGLLFEVDEKLDSELKHWSLGKLVTFDLDISAETVNYTSSSNSVALDDLVAKLDLVVEAPHPNYAVYNYADQKLVFIYSCPSGSKVKERMIGASNRQGLISHVKSSLDGVVLDKVMEVGDLDELDLDLLKESKDSTAKLASSMRFSKPKGPRRR